MKRMRPTVPVRAPKREWALAALWAAFLVAAIPAPAAPAEELQDTTWNPLNRLSAGHFQVRDPADLDPAEAEAVYRRIAGDLKRRYALSGLAAAARYQSWRRYSRAPYKSISHGRTYLSNYANAKAANYGAYENAGDFAVGAILAKDSFQFTSRGELRPGPLFLMEKMPAGFNPPSGDWRYTEVLPDGSVLGVTKGENSDKVDYCAPCHADGARTRRTDHVFFPKLGYRRVFPDKGD